MPMSAIHLRFKRPKSQYIARIMCISGRLSVPYIEHHALVRISTWGRSMLILIFSTLALMAAATIIPGPPGPYPVALRVKAFEDAARWDPHAPQDQPEKRRVMVSVHVPLKKEVKCSVETVPYMPHTTAVALGQGAATLFGLPDTIFSGMELEFCNIDTACAEPGKGEKHPLFLFSHGRASSRLAHGVLARSFASYGYIVVTLDHTYDAAIVEFPDGSIRFAENATNNDMAYVESLLEVSLPLEKQAVLIRRP